MILRHCQKLKKFCFCKHFKPFEIIANIIALNASLWLKFANSVCGEFIHHFNFGNLVYPGCIVVEKGNSNQVDVSECNIGELWLNKHSIKSFLAFEFKFLREASQKLIYRLIVK
jgi:hypothetical protein